jgi:transposase-like protein
VEQKRDFVLRYTSVPYGSRSAFALQAGLDRRVIAGWRRQLAAGTLEQGLVPRGGGLWPVEENKEVARLVAEVADLRAQLDRAKEARASQDRVVDALGKAIELLRDVHASKGSAG